MSTSQRPHKKLRVWQKAMELATRIYKITAAFPRSEDFVLTSQLRRAAVSVPSNIAEGLSRARVKERVHFLYTSQGSLSELDTQVELAKSIEYIDDATARDAMGNIQEVQMLLSGLIRSLKVRTQCVRIELLRFTVHRPATNERTPGFPGVLCCTEST